MAIIEDALDTLATLINGAVYPDGTDETSVAEVDVLTYPGWPAPDDLDNDIKAGGAHISIFPRPEERVIISQPGPWTQTSDTTEIRTLRVQEQLVHFTIWAPSPGVRASLFRAIDPAIAKTPRMLMPDGSWAMLRYRNAYTDDNGQKAGIFRKDVFCFIEYATTETRTSYEIIESTVNVGAMT